MNKNAIARIVFDETLGCFDPASNIINLSGVLDRIPGYRVMSLLFSVIGIYLDLSVVFFVANLCKPGDHNGTTNARRLRGLWTDLVCATQPQTKQDCCESR